VRQQITLFIDEMELREQHGVERSVGEIHILHDSHPTLHVEVIRCIVHALGQVVTVLMETLEQLPRVQLRHYIFEDGAVMPNCMELKVRHHADVRREKCIFVRGLARFVFTNRDFHNHAHHVGIVGNPLSNLRLSDVQFMDHSTNMEYLLCFCSFFRSTI